MIPASRYRRLSGELTLGAPRTAGAAFEQFVLRILEHDPEIELLAAGMSYGPHGFDFAARRMGKPLLVDA
jgi:hypothetical protein